MSSVYLQRATLRCVDDATEWLYVHVARARSYNSAFPISAGVAPLASPSLGCMLQQALILQRHVKQDTVVQSMRDLKLRDERRDSKDSVRAPIHAPKRTLCSLVPTSCCLTGFSWRSCSFYSCLYCLIDGNAMQRLTCGSCPEQLYNRQGRRV